MESDILLYKPETILSVETMNDLGKVWLGKCIVCLLYLLKLRASAKTSVRNERMAPSYIIR